MFDYESITCFPMCTQVCFLVFGDEIHVGLAVNQVMISFVLLFNCSLSKLNWNVTFTLYDLLTREFINVESERVGVRVKWVNKA